MVEQGIIEIPINENFYQPGKYQYDTDKTVVKRFDKTESLDLLSLVDNGIQCIWMRNTIRISKFSTYSHSITKEKNIIILI